MSVWNLVQFDWISGTCWPLMEVCILIQYKLIIPKWQVAVARLGLQLIQIWEQKIILV